MDSEFSRETNSKHFQTQYIQHVQEFDTYIYIKNNIATKRRENYTYMYINSSRKEEEHLWN